MSGQRFVNMMLSCCLPRQPDLTGPALRVVATASARGHLIKQECDRGHTATRIFNSTKHTLRDVSTHGRKLSYNDFLAALMRVAVRVFRNVAEDVAFEALLKSHVMPYAYSSASQLPFGISAIQAAEMVTDPEIVQLLDRFGPALFDVFSLAKHRANKRHGMSRRDIVESVQATGAHVSAVSHTELLSYADYLRLCSLSFYFQHQQQQNVLSVYHLGQIFVSVKEGGGHGLHLGHITFDEFLFAFCLLALSMSYSFARKHGIYPETKVASSSVNMVKALLHRMTSCPGIMEQKMRCYSKFKHVFQDMYHEDGKPWRYLNLPGAPTRVVSPKKVIRRLSLSAAGHISVVTETDQLAARLGFDPDNGRTSENVNKNGHEPLPHRVENTNSVKAMEQSYNIWRHARLQEEPARASGATTASGISRTTDLLGSADISGVSGAPEAPVASTANRLPFPKPREVAHSSASQSTDPMLQRLEERIQALKAMSTT